VASIPTWFGPRVGGYVNCTAGVGDDFASARNFLTGLKSGNFGLVTNVNDSLPTDHPYVLYGLLSTSVAWPKNLGQVVPNSNPPDLNPIRYNSSSPVNNPKSYDLWVDIFVGGKTNRISNWNPQPEFVNY
jgi:hypothetical protein